VSSLDTLVEISKVARMFADSLLYRRFVSNMAAVVLLTVITGMLAGTLLIGGCYAGYLSLIRHGFDTDVALLIIGGGIALATALCAALTIRFIRKLRNALIPVPAIPQVRRITQAFMDGLSESSHKE
jgi:hypothetical protein